MGLSHSPALPTFFSSPLPPSRANCLSPQTPAMGLHTLNKAADWQVLLSGAFSSGQGRHLHVKAASLPMSLGMCIKPHLGLQRGGTCVLKGAMIYDPQLQKQKKKTIRLSCFSTWRRDDSRKVLHLEQRVHLPGSEPETSPSSLPPQPYHLLPSL